MVDADTDFCAAALRRRSWGKNMLKLATPRLFGYGPHSRGTPGEARRGRNDREFGPAATLRTRVL
jgi:hypothetical protein